MKIQPWLSSSLDLVSVALSSTFALSFSVLPALPPGRFELGIYVHGEGGGDSMFVLILLFEFNCEFVRFFPSNGLSHDFVPRYGSW